MTTTFQESDRVNVRKWLGYSAIFLQADPRLENALTSVQSTVDGGSRPDDSTVIAILSYITELNVIEQQWKALVLQGSMQAGKIDELGVDPLRGLQGLKQVGRMYVGYIADALATKPHRDVFSTPKLLAADGADGPFADYSRGYPQW